AVISHAHGSVTASSSSHNNALLTYRTVVPIQRRRIRVKIIFVPTLALFLTALAAPCVMHAQDKLSGNVRHVLLISIDGMHELEFLNCSNGISTVNSGDPYCPNLAYLAESGVHFTQAMTPFPSDSFPGL